MSAELSVILPAKNESRSIGSVIKQIREHLPDAEVIVVDDGSTDDTATIAEQAGARVISHPYAKGNGAAIKSGARGATGSTLVFMDADGQHDPADITRLLTRLETYDMVVGARRNRSHASLSRGLANRFYNLLASYMTGQHVADLTSGFRAVHAGKFREFLYLLPNGFSYPTTITMAFFRAGYSVAYEPINAAQREGNSHLKPWKDGVRFLLIIFKIGTLYSPLKLFFPAALAFLLLGLGWYVYTFGAMNRFTNMSALLISASFIVFMMGLISEQITALIYKSNVRD
ncbi:MAG TPA: glycosyltransferase family 2 protein [Gammaproteobacteria bacterium]